MTKPLRILHLTLGADAGGLSRYVTDLGLAMHRAGHDITVAGDTGAWQPLFDSMPFPYVTIPLKGGPLKFLSCVTTLNAIQKQRPFDVIHTHYRRATVLARRMQKRVPTPILYTVHLSHISLKFPRNLLTDFGDHTHVASADARDWVITDAHVAANRVSLIPHGVDAAKFPVQTPESRATARRKLHLADDDLVALFVGRLDYPKNEGWLIDLAERTKTLLPKLKLLLVGEGPHEGELREQIAAKGLANRVRLEGHQSTLAYYQAADALLLPSIREGFSLVCAEAMSCGVPCLRTRTSGTSELIVEGVTGRSTPIDREYFLTAAETFLADGEALQQMGEAAAARIRERFTFDHQVAGTVDLYSKLAARLR